MIAAGTVEYLQSTSFQSPFFRNSTLELLVKIVGRIEELALHLGEGDLFVGEMLADELLRLFGQFADADRTIVVGTDGRGAEGEHCGSENQKLFHGVSFFK